MDRKTAAHQAARLLPGLVLSSVELERRRAAVADALHRVAGAAFEKGIDFAAERGVGRRSNGNK